MDKITKKYSNGDITIVWKPDVCVHSKLCWTELLEVFDPRKRPWIDMTGAETERIIEQVQRCPSGALSFFRNDENSAPATITAENLVEVKGSIVKAHYRTEITASGHMFISDESVAEGGTDLGPSPSALLAASLASCTAITLRMYADRKGWDLTQADIYVTLTRDVAQNITKISRKIKLSGALNTVERERLLAIANKCPVHQMLTNPIEIISELTN